MKETVKESWYICPKCNKEESVKYSIKELEDEVSVNVYKCTNCKHQPGLKELWEYQYRNQDKL
ncbi:hypothetical protein [Flavobacterium sp.]|jgi:transcription elongation factor Elf1|uniref:hypothetical protein n=1 Tax=Flavobacterium sp. TaxID=239 RepID=UPI0037BF9AB4